MPSATETALAGLKTVIDGISGPTVKRNIEVPTEVPAEGLIIVRDGDPGEPDVTLSPTIYHYEHLADVEVLVQDDPSTRDASWDTLVASIGTAITADTTLGGTVDLAEAERPQDVEAFGGDGAAGIKGGTIPVTLYYSTQSPLQ